MWSFHWNSNLILLDDGLSSAEKDHRGPTMEFTNVFLLLFTGELFDLLRAENGEFNRKNKLFEC